MLKRPTLHAGFTLTEAMVVIAIIAIIMAVGTPSLQSWMVSLQVKAKSDAILNGMQLARSEAIRRNTRVHIIVSNDSSWSVGCVTVVGDTDGDGIPECPGTIQSKTASEAGTVDQLTLLPIGATQATFNGVGTLSANADGSANLSQVDISKSGGGASANRRILLTPGGQSRICDTAVTTTGAPEKC